MNETRLTSVGILRPPEFPTETYNKVHLCLVKYGNTHPAQRKSFSLGWNGLAYRYRALVDYGEEFTTSVKASNSPPPEEPYKQEKALFGFVVNAASAIECFFYSAYCMASILDPDTFPISKSEDLTFYPVDVVRKFKAKFSGNLLLNQMTSCIGASKYNHTKYNDIKDMRDVSIHRGVAPRTFYVGGDRNGVATMPENIRDPIDQWRFDLAVDVQTTASYRQWLDNMLNDLINAAEGFCNRRL